MMKFLALAVTFGFSLIAWRINQSMLNPLILEKKRREIFKKGRVNESNRYSEIEGDNEEIN